MASSTLRYGASMRRTSGGTWSGPAFPGIPPPPARRSPDDPPMGPPSVGLPRALSPSGLARRGGLFVSRGTDRRCGGRRSSPSGGGSVDRRSVRGPRAGEASSQLGPVGARPVRLLLRSGGVLSNPLRTRRPFGLPSISCFLGLALRRSGLGSVGCLGPAVHPRHPSSGASSVGCPVCPCVDPSDATGALRLSVGSFFRAGLRRMLARPRLFGGGELAGARSTRAGGAQRLLGVFGWAPRLFHGPLNGWHRCWRIPASLSVQGATTDARTVQRRARRVAPRLENPCVSVRRARSARGGFPWTLCSGLTLGRWQAPSDQGARRGRLRYARAPVRWAGRGGRRVRGTWRPTWGARRAKRTSPGSEPATFSFQVFHSNH